MTTLHNPDNPRSTNQISRRTLLKRTALLSLSLPLALQVAACAAVPPGQATNGAASAPAAANQANRAGKTVRLTWGKGGLTLYSQDARRL